MKPDAFDASSQSVFHYLCPRHQAWIAVDHASAVALWRDAMAKGQAAYQMGGIRRSRLFFGAAYETVVVRMRQPDATEADLDVVHLGCRQVVVSCALRFAGVRGGGAGFVAGAQQLTSEG